MGVVQFLKMVNVHHDGGSALAGYFARASSSSISSSIVFRFHNPVRPSCVAWCWVTPGFEQFRVNLEEFLVQAALSTMTESCPQCGGHVLTLRYALFTAGEGRRRQRHERTREARSDALVQHKSRGMRLGIRRVVCLQIVDDARLAGQDDVIQAAAVKALGIPVLQQYLDIVRPGPMCPQHLTVVFEKRKPDPVVGYERAKGLVNVIHHFVDKEAWFTRSVTSSKWLCSR